ncbi:iron ABC transporter permease [Arthrobacter tecti]
MATPNKGDTRVFGRGTFVSPAEAQSGSFRQQQTPGPSRANVRRMRPWVFSMGMLVILAAGLLASGMVGGEPASPGQVLDIAYRRLWGLEYVAGSELIISEIRLPRGLLAAAVGASLALVGCILQAIVRNPLADPSILGGTAGASLGAVGAIMAGGAGLFGLGVAGGAFLGAAVGFASAMALAAGRAGLSPLRLVLAGVAVSFLFSALTSLVILRAGDDRRLRSALFWQLGSVASATWDSLLLPLIMLAVGVGYLLVRARRLDALVFGDATAHSLGVNPLALRIELLIASALITGVSVALAGGVGFVGLVIPHVVRMVVGPSHRALLPCSITAGAAFLVLADVVGRVIALPNEAPLGVVTALVGAPVFAWLMRTRMRQD